MLANDDESNINSILLILFHLSLSYDIGNLYSDIQCFSHPSVVVHDSQFWLFFSSCFPFHLLVEEFFFPVGNPFPQPHSTTGVAQLYPNYMESVLHRLWRFLPHLVPSSESTNQIWHFQGPFLLTHEEGLSKNKGSSEESRIGRWAKTESQWLIWASAWNQGSPLLVCLN